MIKNIVFDIGMVLVDFRYMDYCRDLGFDEETVQRLVNAMILSPYWNNLDMGIISQEELIGRFKEENPDLEREIDTFWRDLTEIVHSFPGSKKWLSDLRSRGYNIYLLTNYPEEMFALHCKTQFDFLGYADGMVVSSHVKLTKPDSRIYECLLSKYGLNACECVFLDDKAENTAAAAALGFNVITVADQESAIAELDRLLIKDRSVV